MMKWAILIALLVIWFFYKLGVRHGKYLEVRHPSWHLSLTSEDGSIFITKCESPAK